MKKTNCMHWAVLIIGQGECCESEKLFCEYTLAYLESATVQPHFNQMVLCVMSYPIISVPRFTQLSWCYQELYYGNFV